MSAAIEAVSASEVVVTVELDPETVAGLESEWKRLCGISTPPLRWEKFLNIVLAVGMEQLRKMDMNVALDLILSEQAGDSH